MKAIKKMLFFLIKILADVKKHSIFAPLYHAKVAQLVERQPSKLNVAGSNPVFRSVINVFRPKSLIGVKKNSSYDVRFTNREL